MPNKSFVEDMMTMASGALGNLVDARHELKSQARSRVGAIARELELVSRDEFDAAFVLLAKARDAQESLAQRLAKIESVLGLSSAKKPVKTKKPSLPSVKPKRSTRKKAGTAKRP